MLFCVGQQGVKKEGWRKRRQRRKRTQRKEISMRSEFFGFFSVALLMDNPRDNPDILIKEADKGGFITLEAEAPQQFSRGPGIQV